MNRGILLMTTSFLLLAIHAFAYNDGGARDPFWPLISASGTIVSYGDDISIAEMVLEGIVSDGDGNYTAIINGAIVQTGETIGAYRIESIEAKKILLLKENEIFELHLKNGGE